MNNVKFEMNLEDGNCHVVEDAFKKAKVIFNWQFDEDFNAVLIDEDIYNKVINSFQDSLTEFLVQVYQNGTDYRTVFTNSNKYSDKMINDFKDTYISVLSNY